MSKRLFIRWQWNRWSRWHITDNRRPGWTLCGMNYSLEYEVSEVVDYVCKKCKAKEAAR